MIITKVIPDGPYSGSMDTDNDESDDSTTARPLADFSELTAQEEAQLAATYKMPIFMLSLHYVHYHSLSKNDKYYDDFMDRFEYTWDRILQLPEFDQINPLGLPVPKLRECVLGLATKQSLQFGRQLVLTFHKITGTLKTEKKFRVTLIQDQKKVPNDGHSDGLTDTALDTSELLGYDEAGDTMSIDEDFLDYLDPGAMESDSQVTEYLDPKSHEPEWMDPDSLDQDSLDPDSLDPNSVDIRLEPGSFETEMSDIECFELPEESEPLNLFLGEIQLAEGVQYLLTLPKETNLLESDLYIKLALMDVADPTGREYIRIKISEALITGYMGLRRKFAIILNEDDEAWGENFEFGLSVKWQVNAEDYRVAVKNPVEILEMLPGALFVLGEYYWHFVAGFYKWALLECGNSFVRYTAIQIFHELCLMLSPTLLYDQMTNIYRSMYPPGGYPQLDTLPHLTESEYLLEPLSQLDNVMHVFGCLFKDEQIELLRVLLPHSTLLVCTRFRFTKRLVELLRNSVSKYSVQSYLGVLIPFATDLLNLLARVSSPAQELQDPRSGVITWAQVNSLARHLCRLVVECIHATRPQHWSALSMTNYKMAGICALLSETIRTLWNPEGVGFLAQIYLRLVQVKVLKRAQLMHFLAPARIYQYQEWTKYN